MQCATRTLARIGLLLTVATVAPGAALAADCAAPVKPSLPDGATSTMEEMLAGQKAVKAFQVSNTEYMQCLERDFNAAESNAESADAATRALAQAAYSQSVEAYNAAVSAEEEIAGAFNIELREFNAAKR